MKKNESFYVKVKDSNSSSMVSSLYQPLYKQTVLMEWSGSYMQMRSSCLSGLLGLNGGNKLKSASS